MNKEVIFVLIEKFADWEGAYLAAELKDPFMHPENAMSVKTLGLSSQPIESIGGFKVIPDYDLSNYPEHFAGLVLIGGTSWRQEHAKQVMPLIFHALKIGAVIGAICDASQFMATHGFLNACRHTSNALEDLLSIPGTQYRNRDMYQNEQAVRDEKMVTANGSASLEFAREMLVALGVYSPAESASYYEYYKLGHVDFMKKQAHEKHQTPE